jgi:hypothetical protein
MSDIEEVYVGDKENACLKHVVSVFKEHGMTLDYAVGLCARFIVDAFQLNADKEKMVKYLNALADSWDTWGIDEHRD